MKKIELKIDMKVLDSSLADLSKLKKGTETLSKATVSISKGNAVMAETAVINAFQNVDNSFNSLVDETIKFIEQAKKQYVEFDEEFANSMN